MYVCNSSICDTAGNLMFYTNGCAIAGADDAILENGADLNPGNVYEAKCTVEGYYTSGYQSALILPAPEADTLYYVFHKRITYVFNPFDIKVDKLFYSIVDMNANTSKGKVTTKNMAIMSDDIAYGQMTAVKHANGKDWWLVTPKDDSNTFYIFLFTKDGIVDTIEQTIGTAPPVNASGGIQMVFSPDGSKLFRTNPKHAVKVYDFDRALGTFTAYDSITVDYKNYPDPVTTWCAVSPNNRYLYVTTSLYVFQFDLWSSDISASQQVVAEWDGFKAPIGTTFGACQLGPDCKIYIVTIDSKYYHVINHPDEPGPACDVAQHSFIFPTSTGASMPIFPNYRLGPLDNPGVPCTATVAAGGPAPVARPGVAVYPNPARERVSVAPRGPLPAGTRWILCDLYGRALREEELCWGTACGKDVPLDDLAAGVYVWTLRGPRGEVLGSDKLLKMNTL